MSERLTVLAGPSGVGKGSVVAELRRRRPSVWLSISWTTRPARSAEVDGEHYVFVTDERFRAEIATGGFLEYAEFAGHFYGTPRAPVETASGPGLLEIDVQGARQVRRAMPTALQVLLIPPSLDELARRLRSRGTDDEARIRVRLEIAERELASAAEFDAVIVNDDVASAAEQLLILMDG